jgi:hypothetical protein
MKFTFLNDTGRTVYVHVATQLHGTICDASPINHLESRVFEVPEGSSPLVKMWDYGEQHGLQILVSPALGG